MYAATPTYLDMMGVTLRAGRLFTARDTTGTPLVVLVNETMARTLWPGQSALGKCVKAGYAGSPELGDPMAAAAFLPCREVVGVVRDGKYRSLTEDPQPHFYQPFAQTYEPDMVLVARTEGDPRGLAPQLLREARALDPELPVEAGTMEEHLGLAVLPQRIGSAVLGAFGIIAALLAALGLYGVMAYAVSQRTPEIGIRVALGASARDVRLLVVRRALALTVTGLGLGLLGAAAAARALTSFLVGVSPTSPAVLLSVAGMFTAVALLASWVPAQRAASVDPVRALRFD
jgi:predicted permease